MRKSGRYMPTAEDRLVLRKWTCWVLGFYCTLILVLYGVSTVLRPQSPDALKSQSAAAKPLSLGIDDRYDR